MKAPDRASKTTTCTSKVRAIAGQSMPLFGCLGLPSVGTDASHERISTV
jgi:hypothetical protein